jgi:uncharacterized protein (TIGR03437 family)
MNSRARGRSGVYPTCPWRLVMMAGLCGLLSAQTNAPARQGLYLVSPFAGSNPPPALKQGPAGQVALALSRGLAIGPSGDIYFANFCAIDRVSGGNVDVYATSCIWQNGGPIFAYNLATDSQGNLYVADGELGRIIRVTPGGDVSPVAGMVGPNCSGDGGPATAAGLLFPLAVAADSKGNLYASCGMNIIRKVTPDGQINTLATLPQEVSAIGSLACDPLGNVYAATANGVTNAEDVYRVSPDGTAVLLAGNLFVTGYPGSNPDIRAWRGVLGGIAADAAGHVYVSSRSDNRIRKIDASGTVSIVAGNGETGELGDGGPASAAELADPDAMAIDGNGDLVFADHGSNKLRKIVLSATPPRIELVAGGGSRPFADGPGSSAIFGGLEQITRDSNGNLYAADTINHRIRKVAPDGTASTVAGNGLMGFAGDGQAATAASLNGPTGVGIDSKGNLWIADTGNRRIRKVTPDGEISTAAGTGHCAGRPPACGQTLPGAVPALSTNLDLPFSLIAIDPQDNAYFWQAETGYSCCQYLGQLLKLSNGLLSPVWAGTVGGAAFDAAGNLYVSGSFSGIQRIGANGVATVFAGLMQPGYLVFDSTGNLYANADYATYRISADGTRIEPMFAGAFGSSFVIGAGGVVYATWYSGGIPAVISQYTPAPAAGISIVSGNNQTGPEGTTLRQWLEVKVVDSGGNAISNVPVQFHVASGSATLRPPGDAGPSGTTVDVVTYTTAQVYVTVNSAGPITVTAAVAGLPSVTFNLTAQACSFMFTPSSIAVPAAGAYAKVMVTTNPAGCPWQAQSNADWLTAPSPYGTGDEWLNYTVAPNTGVARTATLTIRGTSATLSQAAGPPGPLVNPLIGNATWTLLGLGINSGEWITIKGFNLAPDTRSWTASDLVGKQLPQALDGVSVQINGKPAYVSYISPTQINALTPADDTLGPVDLQVSAPNGSSQAVTVQKVAFDPAFFVFDHKNNYAAAVLPDGALAAPPGYFGDSVVSRLPVPGDTIQLFATGLGPTNPPYPDGQALNQPLPLANPVSVAIGTFKDVATQFVGLVAPGLYQINLTVPPVPPGLENICLSMAGVQAGTPPRFCMTLPTGQ